MLYYKSYINSFSRMTLGIGCLATSLITTPFVFNKKKETNITKIMKIEKNKILNKNRYNNSNISSQIISHNSQISEDIYRQTNAEFSFSNFENQNSKYKECKILRSEEEVEERKNQSETGLSSKEQLQKDLENEQLIQRQLQKLLPLLQPEQQSLKLTQQQLLQLLLQIQQKEEESRIQEMKEAIKIITNIIASFPNPDNKEQQNKVDYACSLLEIIKCMDGSYNYIDFLNLNNEEQQNIIYYANSLLKIIKYVNNQYDYIYFLSLNNEKQQDIVNYAYSLLKIIKYVDNKYDYIYFLSLNNEKQQDIVNDVNLLLKIIKCVNGGINFLSSDNNAEQQDIVNYAYSLLEIMECVDDKYDYIYFLNLSHEEQQYIVNYTCSLLKIIEYVNGGCNYILNSEKQKCIISCAVNINNLQYDLNKKKFNEKDFKKNTQSDNNSYKYILFLNKKSLEIISIVKNLDENELKELENARELSKEEENEILKLINENITQDENGKTLSIDIKDENDKTLNINIKNEFDELIKIEEMIKKQQQMIKQQIRFYHQEQINEAKEEEEYSEEGQEERGQKEDENEEEHERNNSAEIEDQSG